MVSGLNFCVFEEQEISADNEKQLKFGLLFQTNSVMAFCKVLSEPQYMIENDTTETAETTYASVIEGKFFWDYHSTLTLISLIGNRYNDLTHPVRRKTVWEHISNDMASNNVPVNAKCCWQKWKNLLRTFNQTKEIKSRSRRFQYFEPMLELLTMKEIPETEESVEIEMDEDGANSGIVGLKRKMAKQKAMKRSPVSKDSVEAKAAYYKEKKRYIFNKDQREAKKLEQHLLFEERRLRIQEDRIKLEKRKLEILSESLKKHNPELSKMEDT